MNPIEMETIVRRVPVPPSAADAAISELPSRHDLHVELGGEFSPAPAALVPTWRTRGRLSFRRPLARFARVNVEVAQWSDKVVELRLSPVTHHMSRWGERRQRRYFDEAHRAADDLVSAIAG